MKTIFCIPAMLCLYAYGLAQPISIRKTALSIGDTMPEFLLHNVNNYPAKSISFSAFRKELTIIDFWASWCGACVGSFPKMHILQNKYEDKLQLLMVNASAGEDAKKMQAFFQRRKSRTGNDFTLPYILEDTLLSRLFPYRVIPHYVWVNKNGRVLAITDSEEVTEANIASLLQGRQPKLAFKNDALLFDDTRDELLAGTAAANEGLLYSSMLTGARPGKGQKLFWKSTDGLQVEQLRIFNYSLIALYNAAFRNAFENSKGRLEVQPGLEDLAEAGIPAADRCRYCYELLLPATDRQAALRFLATDLERYFNITAVPVKRMVPVFVLSAGQNMRSLLTSNGAAKTDMNPESIAPFMNNVSMQQLSDALQIVLKSTIINETRFSKNIDIRFPAAFFKYNPEQVSAFLEEHGLILQKGERLLTVARLQRTDTILPLLKTNEQ